MILGDLSDTKRVEALHPLLGKLFSYIKEHDFLSDPIGRIELDGDRVFINNDYPVLRSQSEQVIEVHRRYLDVHVPLDAPEIVGWKPLCDLKEVQRAYSCPRRKIVPFILIGRRLISPYIPVSF